MLLLILFCLSILFSDGVIRCLFLSLLFFILIYFSFIFCSSLYLPLWRTYLIFASLIFCPSQSTLPSLCFSVSLSLFPFTHYLFVSQFLLYLFLTLYFFTLMYCTSFYHSTSFYFLCLHSHSSISWSIWIFSPYSFCLPPTYFLVYLSSLSDNKFHLHLICC